MELVVSGWGRDHGEKVIARRDLTEARSFSSRGYSRPEVYVTTTEGKETSPFGVRAVDNGKVELRYYAKITLNGEYLVRQTMSRKEVARLFLSLYEVCSLQELLEVMNEVAEVRPNRNFPPVMLKSIKDIGLTDATAAWLTKNRILLIGDLVLKTEHELRALSNGSDHAVAEIKDRLTPLGLQMGMQVHAWPSLPKVLYRKLDEFDVSVRTANCLKNDNILYLGDLVQRTEAEMLRTSNFGRKSLNEIKEVILGPLDLHLGMEIPNWRTPGT